MPHEETVAFWDQNFEKYLQAIGQSEIVTDRVFPLLAKHVSKQDTVLDFGCGGGLLIPSLQHCEELWLYDPAIAAVKYASDKFAISPRRCTSELSELPENHFTVVIACFVLMSAPTLQDERTIIENIARMLRSGGRALFVITDPANRGVEFSFFRTEFLQRGDEQSNKVDPPFDVILLDRHRAPVLRVMNFHRSLDVTVGNIEKSGLEIELVHPIPDYSSSGYYNCSKSPYVFLLAEKGPASSSS